ncbi:alcohol dehydrogenase [Ascodesmis nigricans]|uniref:Alcohol dehydrogenase n=1 Tax=Ascodesmis nigricans TaxID=341454 RepID=A0A4V3SHS6_9PEZI|nr:alcohol dehydrogenase [Ascodesmis nigricans]
MPKAIGLKKIPGKPGQVYYPLETLHLPSTPPPPGSATLHLLAASLNHRDLFQRRHLYPNILFSSPILADGCGLVTTPTSPLYGKRVIINPSRGWVSSPVAPEEPFAILGASIQYPSGTLQEEAVFDENELVEAPEHLDDVRAAALPLCGTTAWRAVFTKGGVKEGMSVLIPGIGGGVAIMAAQFCVAAGARVWVTSSSTEKIQRAVEELGVEGGVLYTGEKWQNDLAEKMKARGQKALDVVVDGAGGDVVVRLQKLLKQGAKVVSYGMTTGPKMDWPMGAVLKNIDLVGSTMGSRREFRDMVRFVAEKRIVPVVSSVVEGFGEEEVESLFEEMDKGRQFGKLVIRISNGEEVLDSKL